MYKQADHIAAIITVRQRSALSVTVQAKRRTMAQYCEQKKHSKDKQI
jgi:hypothetical protein